MHTITRELVQKNCYPQSYLMGLSDYLRGKVVNIDVDKDRYWEGDFFTEIYGKVEETKGEFYKVEVDFSSNKGFNFFRCECETFLNCCNNEKFCKHIAAVLLKYIEDYVENKGDWRKNIGKLNIAELLKPKYSANKLAKDIRESLYQSDDLRCEVNLEPTFVINIEHYKKECLELKIGLERLYVVKNIRDLLYAVFDKNTLEFGKLFTYNPKRHKFRERDFELLKIINELYEIHRETDTGNSSIIRGKQVTLTSSTVKRVLKLYEGESILLSLNNSEAKPHLIKCEDLPLNFTLSKSKDEIALDINSKMPVLLTQDGKYLIYENVIYKPSSRQRSIYVPIHGVLEHYGGRILFSQKDKSAIASSILPGLKKISREVKIDQEIQEEIKEYSLTTKVYLDKYDNGIILKLEFFYGDEVKEDEFIVRDIEGEHRVTAFVESCGFIKYKDLFYLDDEDKIIDFIENRIEDLQNISEVYYSDAFKNVQLYRSSFRSSVHLISNDLLEFDFSIDGIDRSEIKGILESVRQRKKYHRLKNGGLLSIESDEIKEFSNMIDYLDIKDSDLLKDKILISKYKAVYMDQKIKSGNINFVERDKGFRDTVNFFEVKDMDFNLPSHLENILREYQKIGFNWFKTLSAYGFGGILADEMGLGKTLQAISFLESQRLDGEKRPSIVISPTSLIYNWEAEIKRFAPDLKTLVIYGSKAERLNKKEKIKDADVIIISYPLIRRDIDEYCDVEFFCCILDEAQQIKNPSSQNAKCVKKIKAKNRFVLTGTPIENSLTELWSIFDFLMPGYLSSHSSFSKKYERPIIKNKDERALTELNRHIKPFILRRLKKDVVLELPPKIEHTILVEMTKEQKKLYLAYLKAIREEIDREIDIFGINMSKIIIISALTRLRQICCDPSSFIENYKDKSGKMTALLEILEDSIEGGHRVLLFSQFTSVLKNIGDMLTKNNIEYMYLDGSTKSEDRIQRVNNFNEGEGNVFLISLKAGGTGLNLASADVVIHFDPWWNPAVEAQATDRAHRIGQTKTVEVIKLVARGTVEEKILKLQEMKREIAEKVIGSDSDEQASISSLSSEELLDLFR